MSVLTFALEIINPGLFTCTCMVSNAIGFRLGVGLGLVCAPGL